MRIAAALLALCIGLATPLQAHRTLAAFPVWPQGAPEVADWPGAAPGPVAEQRETTPGDPWSDAVSNVTVPTLQPFLPERGKATGAAVIVAPGGGFRFLSIRKEGTAVAEWLADHGVAAFVLKYRLVQRLPGESLEAMRRRVNGDRRLMTGVAGAPGAADGIAAIRLVRARAADWGIDPHRVGIMGFSAGGHVAGMAGIAADKADRPDFVGLIYGMPFLDPLPPLPEANLPWPEGTPKEPWLRPKPTPSPGALPPMFLAEAQDDVLVGRHLGGFYEPLLAKGYLPEAHFYYRGSHGFGMKPQGATSDLWIAQFRAWISAQGFDRGQPTAPEREGAPVRPGAVVRDCGKDCPAMVVIPAGTFTMGADAGEDGRPEGPPHAVTIAQPFAMGAREVSNGEYEAFLTDTKREPTPGCRWFDAKTGKVDPDPASNSRHPGPGAGEGQPDMPVVCVSWTDARDYAGWLARKTSKAYRLPSEAEWEWAARGGTTTDFYWGSAIDAGCAYANTLDVDGMKGGAFAVFSAGGGPLPSAKCADGHAGAAPVGSYKPNAFGLYDMIGNVWEWVEDCYVAPYPADAPTDGSAYEVKGQCPRRAVRSGSWMSVPFRNRVSWRGRDPETLVTWIFGFRVARDLTPQER